MWELLVWSCQWRRDGWLLDMATEFIKEVGVNHTEIVGSGAGFEGAIACMDVVLELCMWHSMGTAGGAGGGAGLRRPTVGIEMEGDAVAVNLALMAGVLNKEGHVCSIGNSTW